MLDLIPVLCTRCSGHSTFHILFGFIFGTEILVSVEVSTFAQNISDDAYIFSDRKKSWIRTLLKPAFLGFRAYFPATVVKTCELDPGGKYIFATHPHGMG